MVHTSYSDKTQDMVDPTALSAVDKALSVLTAFRPGVDEVGVSELARTLGMTKSTVFRQLDALTRHGLVERTAGRYRLGRRLYQLADQVYEPDGMLWEVLSPVLVRLHEMTHESVHLAVLRGDEMVVIGRLHPEHHAALLRIGATLPAYCTALGKAVIAYDAAALERVVARGLRPSTPNTIVDPAQLRQELASVRETGLAVADRELRSDITAVAVALLGPAGDPVAAISVAGKAARFDVRLAGDLLRRARLEAMRALSRAGVWVPHRSTAGLTDLAPMARTA